MFKFIMDDLLPYLFCYFISAEICKHAIGNMLERIKGKKHHENVKAAAKILWVLCWIPGFNSIYAFIYSLGWIKGILFPTK